MAPAGLSKVGRPDGMLTGLGAGRLHDGDPAEPVVDVLDLAGVPEPGLDEERDDAVVEVAGHGRALCHPGTHQAGQVPEGVRRAVAVRGVVSILGVGCWAAEVDDGDLAPRPEGAERVVRERD